MATAVHLPSDAPTSITVSSGPRNGCTRLNADVRSVFRPFGTTSYPIALKSRFTGRLMKVIVRVPTLLARQSYHRARMAAISCRTGSISVSRWQPINVYQWSHARLREYSTTTRETSSCFNGRYTLGRRCVVVAERTRSRN
jgi:hypothetical protein